jgi:predicted unusual protein kinase regulating ubiquinone biosynthesis (AarF/ABC1/UbiB family)
MIEVRENMMRTDLPVTVPRVMPGLYCKRVLVMRFIEGTKVNDLAKLNRLGVDRELLCARVCHAYAHQIYRNGFFNGDPHPGNIMIIRRSKLLASDPSDPDHPRVRRLAGLPALTDGAAAPAASGADDGADDAADDWIPVLLDFGLTKRLPDGLRMAFAKLVVSAEEMDYAGVRGGRGWGWCRFAGHAHASLARPPARRCWSPWTTWA